jgi:two-component system KDP operon response regulator KdpE
MSNSILVIDDDPTLLELLRAHLEAAGYRALVATDGPGGLQMASYEKPDLIILDVMMPGMDGWEVCELLRKKSDLPIIMLTAKGEELDKLRGFHLGVDDYVTKPFSFAELVARVGAVLGRAKRAPQSTRYMSSGELMISFEDHRVTVGDRNVELTPTEYRLLEVLARHFNRTVAVETLLAEVWGPQYAGEFEHVKHYIWAIRRKIEADPGDPKHLITERGYGYRLE